MTDYNAHVYREFTFALVWYLGLLINETLETHIYNSWNSFHPDGEVGRTFNAIDKHEEQKADLLDLSRLEFSHEPMVPILFDCV